MKADTGRLFMRVVASCSAAAESTSRQQSLNIQCMLRTIGNISCACHTQDFLNITKVLYMLQQSIDCFFRMQLTRQLHRVNTSQTWLAAFVLSEHDEKNMHADKYQRDSLPLAVGMLQATMYGTQALRCAVLGCAALLPQCLPSLRIGTYIGMYTCSTRLSYFCT